MPGPGMVQIDPAQKQVPAAVEVFDARQMRLQAKQEVNLLLEKSKSVVSMEKGKLENLQIISSFTVLAKPGHEKETYNIYRQEVSKANEQLILNKENFDIQLEETAPGKLYIVCGRYEERNLKIEVEIGKEETRQTERVLPAPVAENTKVASTSERERLPQPKFTAKERKDIKISAEVLEGLGSIDLTESQWKVMKERILNVAGGSFNKFSEADKMEAIRRVISPHEYEGKGGLEYPGPDELKNRVVRKAAGTLSDMKGDCDDYSLLFVACVKQMEKEGLLKVEGMKLALMEYYDPKDQSVKAHANILQIIMSDEKTSEKTAVLVDLTVHTKSLNLGLTSKNTAGWNTDLRKMMLEHLNGGREPAEMIKSDYFQMQVYGGSEDNARKYDGVEFYYIEKSDDKKVMESINQAKSYAKKANMLKEEGKLEEAYAAHEKADQLFNDIIDMLKKRVELGKNSGGYYADTYTRLADAYYQKRMNLVSESNTIAIKTEVGTGNSGEKIKSAEEAKGEWIKCLETIVGMDGLSCFALSNSSADEFNRGREHYPKAEELAKRAVGAAPYRKNGYDVVWNVFSEQKKFSEVKALLEGYETTLPIIIRKEGDPEPDLKALLDGYILEAGKKIKKTP